MLTSYIPGGSILANGVQEEDAAGDTDGRGGGEGWWQSREPALLLKTTIYSTYMYILSYPFCCKITKLCACADNNLFTVHSFQVEMEYIILYLLYLFSCAAAQGT